VEQYPPPESGSTLLLKSEDEVSYVEAIEDLFLVLRKQGLMLSPSDRDCVRSWYRDGIPLHRAAQAIVDEIDLFREKKTEGTPLPHMISYFSNAVYRADKAANTVLIEEDSQEREEDSDSLPKPIEACLEQVEHYGKTEKHPKVKAAYRSLYKRLRMWETARQNTGLGPWLRLLHEQEILFMQEILEGLTDEERSPLESKVQARFLKEKKGLGQKARQERLQLLWRTELRSSLGLLDLRDGEKQ
jgi:hypothetical protein